MKINQTLFVLALFTAIICSSIIVVPTAFADCAGVQTALVNCDGNDGVMGILELIVNIMSAGVGIAAVGGVVYGAILYSSASGNVEQTKRARNIIMNVVLGMVAYALTYAFLQWLIPGGVFG